MLRLVVRRLLQLIPTLLGLSVLLFLWLNRLPGGPASAILGERATEAEVARINRALGLDEPVHVQYWRFLKRIFELDLGTSTQTGQPVWDEFALRFPATVELSVAAILIAVAVGIPMGYLAAKRRGGWLDVASVSGSLLGICIPVFFLAMLLRGIFSVELGWFPSQGRLTTGINATDVTGFAVLDGLLTGEFDASWDAIMHLVLLSRRPRLHPARRHRPDDPRQRPGSARRGLHPHRRVQGPRQGHRARLWHVLRNALLPVITAVGLLTGSLLSGAVLTESVFDFGGIGSFIRTAIDGRDYPVLVGFILFIAMVYVLINLLVDLAYSIIDPRVRVH